MSEVKRYRKKPVEVEAIWLDPDRPAVTQQEAIKWARSNGGRNVGAAPGRGVAIYTLEGAMVAKFGDYIIRGVKGELYPCKPDIFEATYEEADDAR